MSMVTRKRVWIVFLAVLICFSFWPPLANFVAAQTADPVTTGQQLFADRCANCHGPEGAGDGEMAAQLPSPPQNMVDQDFLRAAVPANLFATITDGRVEQGMPPFGPVSSNALTEMERWQAIAAIYDLGMTAEARSQGEAVFQENCLACHGENGSGNGPDAASLDTSPADLSRLSFWSGLSDQTVFERLSDPTAIPAHEFSLADDTLWEVIAYARTLGFQDEDAMMRPPSLGQGVISGVVRNGSTGEPVTGSLEATLHAYNGSFTQADTFTTTLDADGRYQFQLDELPADWVYMTTLSYQGLEYTSDIGRLAPGVPALELPLTVFEQSTDAEAVTISQLHITVQYLDNELQVGELYSFNNNQTAVFVGERGDYTQGTVNVFLPEGAVDASFQRGFGQDNAFFPANEFIETSDGWADTLPLRPGPNTLTLLVTYRLPYRDGMIFAHPLPYATDSVNLVLPDGMEVSDRKWTDQGSQATASGVVRSFVRTSIAAGQMFEASLTGKPSGALSALASSSGDPSTQIAVGIGALLLVTAVGGRMVYFKRKRAETIKAAPADQAEAPVSPSMSVRETLLYQIATLDDAYEEGEIAEEEYQRKRQQLKAELILNWELVAEE